MMSGHAVVPGDRARFEVAAIQSGNRHARARRKGEGSRRRRVADLDPVVAAVPMTHDSLNNAESRNGMQPVVDFARTADIAALGSAI
jgi:hypothetical protein